MKETEDRIVLDGVTRRYGTLTALDNVTIRIAGGETAGLLGRNGAGKTTAMNLMTGYLPPSSGRILVDGMDMLEEPRECRRRIGYLPEQPPLYDEMTVTEYLMFVSELKEVVRNARRRHVDEIIERCGLQEVRGRLLGHLSKGYRQRAGMAQALCGSPEILILDEPTAGLDPRQTAEMRELIRQLGQERTVIFSSHLLPEVQQVCQRVIILHEGRIAGDMPITEGAGRRMALRVGGDAGLAAERIRTIGGIREVSLQDSGRKMLTVTLEEGADGDAVRDDVFRALAGAGMTIREMREETEPLEEMFMRLTE